MRQYRRILIFIFVVFSLLLLGCKEKVVDCTLTYMLNGELYETTVVKSNEDLQLEEIEERGGILFSGWYKDDKYTTLFTDKRIKEDTTLYGYYEVGKYRVNFVTNCDVVIGERVIEKGQKVGTIPNMEKEGYEFDGWYRDEDFKIPFNVETDTIGASLTIYAKWLLIEPDYVTIRYVSITEGYYANKDDIYVAYYSYFYDFLKNHTECNLEDVSLEDFLVQGKTWTLNGRSDMYHFGDKYGRYYLSRQVGGTLEEQDENHFMGYCYKNGKFIDLIHHLETFFEYWRTDEGYTGSESDPENLGNDFYAEPWASMVDTAKFFYFTADTLQDKYAWFTSARVKEALDNIPNTLLELKNAKIVKGEGYTLDNSSNYILEFFLDEEATTPVDKINEAQTSCDECDEIIIYVRIQKME